MHMSMMKILPFAFLALIGCGGGETGGAQTQEEDIAEYESLRADLEGKRSVFIEGPAQDFQAAGNTLFWVEAAAGNPLLHSYDAASKQTTDYTFKVYLVGPSSPNPIDNLNYIASTSMVVSMNELDGANAYAVGQPMSSLGKLVLPAPPFGQKWWAYSVDASNLYVMILENADSKYHLKRWSPGETDYSEVLVLDDLIAPNVMGEFHNFAVSGTTLIFDEGNRIWISELTDTKAKFAKNEQHVGFADFQKGGAVYNEGSEFFRYDVATDTRENLSEKIRNNAYTLNKTYEAAHHPVDDTTWAKYQSTIFYEANFGIFAYNIDSDTVKPMLLDARDNSVVYKYPTVLANGTIFVKGLESSSGAIGADGPTFTFVP
jgi:hypothetical protein